MIKICHMTSAHQSNDIRIFEKECISLAQKKEYQVYIVAQGDSYTNCNVTIIGVGRKPDNRFLRMALFTKIVYKTALDIDADIYHFHDAELLPYGLKLVKKGKKVVFDSHEDTGASISKKKYILKWLRPLISKVFNIYQNSIITKCSGVVSVTPHLCKRLEQYNSNTHMITNYPIVIKNGIERKKDRKQSGIQIVFAGGVGQQWSHEYIIEAISMIDKDINVRYHIYGKANKDYLYKISKVPGWDKVEYHGIVPFEEVQEALYSADIGIAVCQYSENTGGRLGTLGNTKLFEEMHAGIPVIATDFILWKEIVEGNHCGICVNPNSIDEISDAIKYLINNDIEAKKMGKNGRKAIIEKYNWENEEKKLYYLYNKLLYK